MTNPAYEATNSDVEKVEKKKYPSDNYLNEILTNTEFAAVVPIEAVRCMARELMLSRTPHPNGMMQLSNELAEMKRKCAEMEVACDRNYIDGMKTGWNYCDARNSDGFNKCIEHRRALISAGGSVEGE